MRQLHRLRHGLFGMVVPVVLAVLVGGCSRDVVWFENTSDEPVVVVHLASEPRAAEQRYVVEAGGAVEIFSPGECISAASVVFEVRTVDGEVLDTWDTAKVPACPNATWVWPGGPPEG